jgi:hypothetical protein
MTLVIDIKTNFPQAQRAINEWGKQGRFALAVALTRTMRDAKAAEKDEIKATFDRPTPYTQNAVFSSSATKDKLEAEVWLKDDRAGSGTPATKYLLPHIVGGSRSLKRFEKRMQHAGLMPSGTYAVPGQSVKLDQYGNVPARLIVQILSQLGANMYGRGDMGFATGSKRSKRTIRKQRVEYFALTKQHGKLKPGIYGRYKFAVGSAVKPIFIFVSKVNYKQRFKFFEVADKVIRERLPMYFEEELSKALASAR